MVKWLSLACLLGLVNSLHGQSRFTLETFAGGNYSSIRNHVLSGERPRIGFHFGVGTIFTPSPNWKRVTIGANLLISEKGYKQTLNKEFDFQFYYASVQLIAGYKFSNFLRGYGGVDLSGMIESNIDYAEETYKTFDVGLVTGLRLFDSKVITINMQLVYGLTPMLNYYQIDALGNFKSEIHDLKNTCLSIGVLYRIIK